MLTVRKAEERGHANHGWLDTNHSFSFANYYDPDQMGFRALRVINEDKISPRAGFGMHGHRDMEIITYVLEGELEHQDSLGNGSIIRPGDVQRMSAGTGIQHSEYNHSRTDLVHLLQIWIVPNQQGLAPSYEQKHFEFGEKQGQLRLVASPDGREGSVTVHQDVDLFVAIVAKGDRLSYPVRPNRYLWLQVARGSLKIGDRILKAGDGVAASNLEHLDLITEDTAEVLLFDLA